MKTNQIMIRKMGDLDVHQRTKDGMYNGTWLIKQWNEKTGMKKEIKHFFENENTKAFIKVLEQEENLNRRNPAYLKTRGRYGATWMHPYLFIKFAQWLNPRFEYHVIKFVYDQLIQLRHTAGETFPRLTDSIQSKFGNVQDWYKVAEGLNLIVFGRHETGIRQKATTEQLRELVDLQKNLAFSIREGYIKSWNELLKTLQGIYQKKWNAARRLNPA